MNRIPIVIASVVALVIGAGTVGCSKHTVEGTAGAKLSITKPLDETIKRGEAGEVTVLIDRENFNDPVEIDVTNLPEGVKVTSAVNVIPPGDESLVVTLRADPSAAIVKDHQATVRAKSMNGLEVAHNFRVSVREPN